MNYKDLQLKTLQDKIPFTSQMTTAPTGGGGKRSIWDLIKSGLGGLNAEQGKAGMIYQLGGGPEPTPAPAPEMPPEATGGQQRALPGGSEGYQGGSIVDYLNSLGMDSGFQARADLARQLGISNYVGSASQNIQMLNSLRSGDWGSPISDTRAGTTGTTGGTETTGNPVLDETYETLQQWLEELKEKGQVINPNVELTPEKIAEFMKQAEGEIDPYYSGQMSMAREGLLRSFNYTTDEIQRVETELEERYGKALRGLGEEMAEKGFAFSGRRKREEEELATDVQRNIEERRRQAGFQAGTQARQFAQQWGTGNIPTSTLGRAPEVVSGQAEFGERGGTTPFYQLSDNVYEGLKGEQQYQQEAEKRRRASELESAYRQKEEAKRLRELAL